jgi:hypothetical protein
LDAAHGTFEWRGQQDFRLAQDDVGEGNGGAVRRQVVGAASHIAGDCAGVAGQHEADLLAVALSWRFRPVHVRTALTRRSNSSRSRGKDATGYHTG